MEKWWYYSCSAAVGTKQDIRSFKTKCEVKLWKRSTQAVFPEECSQLLASHRQDKYRPEIFIAERSNTNTGCQRLAHQVLKETSELLSETSKSEEVIGHLRVIFVHSVIRKPLQCLDVLLLILYVSWRHRNSLSVILPLRYCYYCKLQELVWWSRILGAFSKCQLVKLSCF